MVLVCVITLSTINYKKVRTDGRLRIRKDTRRFLPSAMKWRVVIIIIEEIS
ncbi:MAG TPA: hypothetical protein VJ599_09565 [Nitrososphaeraceae archaeon]|nr:hypothetical protein [Nitrososphaeraceae archaeon]